MKLAGILLSLALLAPAALAQSPRIDGHPNLGGVWGTAFVTPLERQDGVDLVIPRDKTLDFAKEFRSHVPAVIDPDFQWQNIHGVLTVNGEARASMIVEPKNGQLPFTDKGKKLAQRSSDIEETWFDNPEERPSADRCV